MPYTTRELLARLIKCEAGGEGDDGMAAVASVVRNRADVPTENFSGKPGRRHSKNNRAARSVRMYAKYSGRGIQLSERVEHGPGGNSLPNRGLGFGRQHLQRGRRQLVFL